MSDLGSIISFGGWGLGSDEFAEEGGIEPVEHNIRVYFLKYKE